MAHPLSQAPARPPPPPHPPPQDGSGEGSSPASLWGSLSSGAWALGDSPTAVGAGGAFSPRSFLSAASGEEAGLLLQAPSLPASAAGEVPGPWPPGHGRGAPGRALQAFGATGKPLPGWEAWSPRAAMPQHPWLQESPVWPGAPCDAAPCVAPY